MDKKTISKYARKHLEDAAEDLREAADCFKRLGDDPRADKYTEDAQELEEDMEEVSDLVDPEYA